MLKHSRTFLVWACFLFVLAAFALIGTLSPSYQKCTADHERHDSQNEQPDLDKTIASSAYVPLFFVCEGAFVDENNGTLTALATIAIAGFTLTLWRATTKQAGLTRDAIELGNREFVATHRPKLILREAFSPITDSLDSRITLAYTIANVGASDCWMAEAQIGLELVREIGYPIFMMPADMSFPNNVPFIGRIVAGEHRRLTFVDPVQVWDNVGVTVGMRRKRRDCISSDASLTSTLREATLAPDGFSAEIRH